MDNQSFPTDFDGIFQQILDFSYDEPVPEIVLRRLLSAVELVIRRELAQKQLSQELAGLRIGYLLQKAGNETNSQLYWVGWGYHSAYDEILDRQLEVFGKTVDYPTSLNENVNFLSDDLARGLVHKLQEEMLSHTPVEVLQDKQIYPFVFGHVVKLFTSERIESTGAIFAYAFGCSGCNGNPKQFKPVGKSCKPCHG